MMVLRRVCSRVLILAPILQSTLAFTHSGCLLAPAKKKTPPSTPLTRCNHIFGMAKQPSSYSANNKDCTEKQIIFVRHSITYMNEYLGRSLRFGAPGFTDVFPDKDRTTMYQDTPLSPNGLKLVQSELARQCPAILREGIDLVVVSPLRRALQTYDLGLRPHMDGKVPVVALPLAAERLYLISDVGSSLTDLKRDFPYVDYSEIKYNDDDDATSSPWWWTPSGKGGGDYTEWRPTGQGQRYACPGEPETDFAQRMQQLQEWLGARTESRIVVVCHHGVIDHLIDMDFDNCQWREVPFSRLLSTSEAR
mgnify:CR=1 FL=1